MGFIIQVKTLVLRRLAVCATQVGIECSCFQVWLCLLPDDHHPPFPQKEDMGKGQITGKIWMVDLGTYKTWRKKTLQKVMEYKEDWPKLITLNYLW
jgi:hypothetical protein